MNNNITLCFPRLLLSVVLMGWGILANAQTSPPKPNVIMIYTDDMGYADISSFSNTDLAVTTPNIDRLATGGMKFTQFYVAMPICSPSRAAVLSGMFAPRSRLTNFLETRVHNNDSDQNDYMDPAISYLPKAFQAAGYATAHVGKWHLGGGRDIDNAPTIRQYGYDEAYSTWESPNPDPYLGIKHAPWDLTNPIEPGQVPRHQRTEYMVNRTLDVLDRHPGQPCFITIWPDDVHTPFVPNAAMISKHGGTGDGANTIQNFYGVLEEYDRQIGRLLDQLALRGLEENTIIFFTGDNGPQPDFTRLRTQGMKGRKSSLYEGGIREPFLIRWPGHIPAGVTNSQTVLSTVDLLPTLTALAGVPLPPAAATSTDGENLSAAMLGTPVTRTKPIFWEHGRTSTVPRGGTGYRSPALAMREGDFKFFMEADSTGKQLYNVRTDPNESTNIQAQNTTLVNSMAARLLAWRNGLPGRNHPYPLHSSVNFAQYVVSSYIEPAALQTAAAAASTSRIDGVAVAPNGQDDVYAIHVDADLKETFLRVDYPTGLAVKLSDSAQIATDLGMGTTGNRTLRAGFDYSPGGDRLFFAEDSPNVTEEVLLASMNVGTHFSKAINKSLSIDGLSDLSTLPDGTIVGARGVDGNRTIGTIPPATGIWTQRISESQLIPTAPGTTSLAPEALAANNSTGVSYVFAHGDGELFRVASVQNAAPGITLQAQTEFASADLHDIAVDQAGNFYGLDVVGAQIIIMRAGDSAIYTVSLANIGAKLGSTSPFVPVPWRGLAARMYDVNHSDLYLASADPQFGIVRLRFGNFPANVTDWTLY